MRDEQERIIAELGVRASIDVTAEVHARTQFMTDYVRFAQAHALVLGISGGQDSSLAGKLCQLAAEALRSEGYDCRFIAVRLPYGIQRDEDDAQRALQFIEPDEVLTFNIKSSVDALSAEFAHALQRDINDFNKGNVKARMRMVAQYAIAGQRNGLVVGTDHAAEAVTGFFTKYGDGGADILPLAGLTKGQGAALLESLGAPAAIWQKIPTADLLDEQPGQSDEENLGTSYGDIDAFLTGTSVSENVATSLESRFRLTRHKRALPVTPADSWWRA